MSGVENVDGRVLPELFSPRYSCRHFRSPSSAPLPFPFLPLIPSPNDLRWNAARSCQGRFLPHHYPLGGGESSSPLGVTGARACQPALTTGFPAGRGEGERAPSTTASRPMSKRSAAFMPQKAKQAKVRPNELEKRTLLRPEGRAPGQRRLREFGLNDRAAVRAGLK